MSIKEDILNFSYLFMLTKIERENISPNFETAPLDLIEFWTEFGVGDIFETETLLSPCNDCSDDSMFYVNYELLHHKIDKVTVFHIGFVLSAYRCEEPRYVVIDAQKFNLLCELNSFEEWYKEVIRFEYADRYGMK